jgi:hypothetical protein
MKIKLLVVSFLFIPTMVFAQAPVIAPPAVVTTPGADSSGIKPVAPVVLKPTSAAAIATAPIESMHKSNGYPYDKEKQRANLTEQQVKKFDAQLNEFGIK